MNKDFITRLTELHEAAALGEVENDPQVDIFIKTRYGTAETPHEDLFPLSVSHGSHRQPRRALLVLLINSLPEQIALNEAARKLTTAFSEVDKAIAAAELFAAFHALNTKGGADE